jgi:type IV pilus assembly protein PilQ
MVLGATLVAVSLAGCATLRKDFDESNGDSSNDSLSSSNSSSGSSRANAESSKSSAPSGDLSFDDTTSSSGTGNTADSISKDSSRSSDSKSSSTDSVDTISGGEADLDAENTLTDIRYLAKKGGTVVIETKQPATFRTRENPERHQVVIDIANTRLPERLKRPYMMQDFGQEVTAVNAYQDSGSSTARVVVQFKSAPRVSVTQAGKRLLVLGTEAPAKGATEEAVDGQSFSDADETSIVDSRILPESSDSTGEKLKFYGKPISIEVVDRPVREVINLIAEQSGSNVIIANGVSGNVSLKLKQIPWDQALFIVMSSNGLGYARQGSVLRIAPLAELQNEAKISKQVQDSARASEPLKVKIIPVSYATVGDIAKQIVPFLTPQRGAATSDTRTNSVIVTDVPEVLDRVSSLIKTLDTPPLQVLIEGKIVEATENFIRSWGIKWGLVGQQVPLGGNLSLQQNNLSIAPTNSPAGNLFYNVRLGTLDIFGDLEASLGLAEKEDIAKIVSAPRVVVLNGESASINQTRSVPYKSTTPSSNPSIAPTVQWQNVDAPLDLKVTPQVTAGADVIMTVNITRTFLGSVSADAPPDKNTRTASTKVMVRNGQTAVIGGIYSSDFTQSEAGVPYLRDVPVVGWLFKSHDVASSKNELLVFITPRIINPEKSLPKEGTL